MNILNNLTNRHRILNKAQKIVAQIDQYKDELRALSGEKLKARTSIFRKRLEMGETIEDMLPEALATVREAAYRAHGMFAFSVQLIGAIVILEGDFAEMKTGEGKTLTIALTAYIGALSQKGVHIVTVNEYLVKRDAEFARRVLNYLGVTVGFNTSNLSRDIKRQMFKCDVTYTTNSELGFDYLRDNMISNYSEKVLRDLEFAIIDEGDSVLIDEARTPLIISGQPQESLEMYVQVDEFVKTLKTGDYKIDLESRSINLLSAGIAKTEKFFKLNGLFEFENSDLIHKINNALMANFVFRNGKEYVVKDDKILLIDQFTGRILQGRSYNAGLQQAIQAKEYVTIEPENIVVATITYQSFFRLYKKIAALSGTGLTEAQEFMKTYNMIVVPVPTNRPVIRKDRPDILLGNKIAKWEAIMQEIKKAHLIGRPILVGTASVEDSEILHQILIKEDIQHEILNARNHAREAEIVAKAGQKYAITISTNMAGRGTDIKLSDETRKLNGLLVIGTDRNESRRIDNQLRGRSGRQGDAGESVFYISLEDNLFKRFATNKYEKLSKKMQNEYFDNKYFSKALSNAQKKVESVNFDMRKNLMDYDEVLSSQRELIYKQRNFILTSKKNNEVLYRMVDKIVQEIVQLFVDAKNTVMINSQLLAESLNEKMFRFPMIHSNDFVDLTISEAEEFLKSIIKKMIDIRIRILGKKISNHMLHEILIHNLDNSWQEHINFMTKLRDSVSLRSLEQKSPLNIYVEEADIAFNKLLSLTAHNTVIAFLNQNIPGVESECYEYAQELRQKIKKATTTESENISSVDQKLMDELFTKKDSNWMDKLKKVLSSQKIELKKQNLNKDKFFTKTKPMNLNKKTLIDSTNIDSSNNSIKNNLNNQTTINKTINKQAIKNKKNIDTISATFNNKLTDDANSNDSLSILKKIQEQAKKDTSKKV